MYKKPIFTMIHLHRQSKGFAMLFTVLVVSLILIIALGIASVTFKQTMLSRLAKDSQIAFYQADAAVECGLHYDIVKNIYEGSADQTPVPDEIQCGNTTLYLNMSKSTGPHMQYEEGQSQKPCMIIIFDVNPGEPHKVTGHGYNICQPHIRQVERALEVRY